MSSPQNEKMNEIVTDGTIVKTVMAHAMKGSYRQDKSLLKVVLIRSHFQSYDTLFSYFLRTKDVKDLSLFYSLQTLIQTHPSPLRSSFLDKLYEDLISHHPSSPEAHVLYATRMMDVESDSPAFVDGLRNANEELIATMKTFSREKDHAHGREMVDAYVQWVEKQVVKLSIDDLVSELRRSVMDLS